LQQLLAVQAADEARHVEVFTRRVLLHGSQMGTSSVGGRASLTSLLGPVGGKRGAHRATSSETKSY
jgi:hypothetical protein